MRLRRLLLLPVCALSLIIASIALVAYGRFHSVEPLLEISSERSVIVTDRSGIVLYESERMLGRSQPIAADELPPRVVAATVAAEDRRFFLHPGLDPIAVARALLANVVSPRKQGGSTISQQTAKLLLQARSKELRRRRWREKLEETLLAFRLERQKSKREILALYLSLAPYGNRITGIRRASEFYFGVPPSDVTPAQAALLASLPHRPSRYNPLTSTEGRARQLRVLEKMHAHGDLSADGYQRAKQERSTQRPKAARNVAPHFVEGVLRTAPAGARRIETTLDLTLQNHVSGIINSHREQLKRHGANNVAVVVLDNQTGEWLAWEGSGDYWSAAGGAIDGVTTPRQPGSTLKPFTYALAFENGFTPASIVPDIPMSFPTAVEGIVYTPRNYDGIFRGPLRARTALASSLNVPATWLLEKSGAGSLLHKLRGLGMSTLDRSADHYGLGLTLGNAEVRLDELVLAYSAFARGGTLLPATKLRSIDEFPVRRSREEKRLFSERAAFWVADVLSDDEARELTFGEDNILDLPFPVAVKTGTSQAYRDNWTVGFTREVTVGVWVGNFDRRELRNSSGVSGAAPIFRAVMEAAVERRASGETRLDGSFADAPEELERVRVCSSSGELSRPECPHAAEEWMPSTAALLRCTWHTGDRTRFPSAFMKWAEARGVEMEAAVTRASAEQHEAFAITSPPDGATYMLDPTLRAEFQRLRLDVNEPASVIWRVDGAIIGRSTAGEAAYWDPKRGKHAIEAMNASGQIARAVVEVR